MPSEFSHDAAGRSAHDDVWLRFLVERMPAVLWSTDLELRFTAGHGAALVGLGVLPNSLNGKSLFEYFQTRDESFPSIKAHRTALAGHDAIWEQAWSGRTYESVVKPLRDRRGQIIGCVGMAFDITSRKNAEVSLRAQFEQLQELLQNVPAMIYQSSGKADFSTAEIPYVSPRAHEYFGLTPEEIYAQPMLVLEAIHPDDRAGYYEAVLRAVQEQRQFDYEFRCVSTTGEVRWMRAISRATFQPPDTRTWNGVLLETTPVRAREPGEISDQVGAFMHNRMRDVMRANDHLQREIVERGKVEESLRRQTHLVNAILTQMPVVAFRVSPDRELEDLQGAAVTRLAPDSDSASVYQALISAPPAQDGLLKALAGGQSRLIVRSDPEQAAWAFDTFLAFDADRQQGAIGFALDVTERDQAVRQLKQSEARWHGLADTSSDTVLLIDREGYITYINRATPGMQTSDVVGTHATQWVSDYRKAEVNARLAQVFATGEFAEYEMDGFGEDGMNAWYATRIGPYRQEGEIIGAVMYITNITLRKRAEQARAATEKRYQLLMDAAHDAIVIIDAATQRVVEANVMAQEFLSKTAEEIAQLPHAELYVAEHRQRAAQRFHEFAAQGHGLITDVELLEIRGHRRPVEVSLRWIEIEGRQLVIGIIRDVTERKRAEQTLRSEERLLRELLNLHEQERRLIAYEIHDGVVQDMVGAHLAIEGVSAQLEAGKTIDLAELKKLGRLLRKAIDEGRRMITELRPMIIDERGIVDAISYLVNEHQLHGGPEVAFTHRVGFQRLSPLLEGTMFRIVQEALQNVQRHSQTSRAEVELLEHDGRLQLIIRDQGVGFDPLKVPADRFGLRGMKERARLFGGQTVIRSHPGRGTEVAVDLPIDLYVTDGDGV